MSLASKARSAPVNFGKLTQTAGTIIRRTLPPRRNARACCSKLAYTNSTTAHTLSFLKHWAKSTLSAAAAAGQAVINLTEDAASSLTPGAIAAGDVLVIRKPDGTYHTGQVSSVSTLAITLTANVPTGGFDSGAEVFFMGAAADVAGTSDFALPASATTTFSDTEAGVCCGNEDGPLVIESNNATAAGTLDYVNGVYIP